jgi:hypothetical protein
MLRVLIIVLSTLVLSTSAQAKHPHHHHRYDHETGQSDAPPHAWCGWWMRFNNGHGDPGPAFNLARKWARWGVASSVVPGAIVVYPHHVIRVIEALGPNMVLAISGNDVHAVRVRPRSLSGAIAIRS